MISKCDFTFNRELRVNEKKNLKTTIIFRRQDLCISLFFKGIQIKKVHLISLTVILERPSINIKGSPMIDWKAQDLNDTETSIS